MFYDKFIKLCIEKNVSPSRVAQQIGLSNAAASGWKKGKIPSDLTINKLANYFGVAVDYFAEEERPENEKKPSDHKAEGRSAIKQELVDEIDRGSDDQAAFVLELIRRMK